jgi:hypothetical protein
MVTTPLSLPKGTILKGIIFFCKRIKFIVTKKISVITFLLHLVCWMVIYKNVYSGLLVDLLDSLQDGYCLGVAGMPTVSYEVTM